MQCIVIVYINDHPENEGVPKIRSVFGPFPGMRVAKWWYEELYLPVTKLTRPDAIVTYDITILVEPSW